MSTLSSRQLSLMVLLTLAGFVVVALALPGGGNGSLVAGTETTDVASTLDETSPTSSEEPATTASSDTVSTTESASTTVFDAVCDGGSVNCPEIVAYDMFGPAIGTEENYDGGATGWGVPWPNHETPILNDGTDFRWLTGGSASNWNDPGDSEQAVYARCKVVPAADSAGTTGFLLQVRDLQSWQRIDGEWSLHQTSVTAGLEGDWYDLADFLGDQDIAATLRTADEAGVWEIPWPADGEIFHFFMGKEDLPAGQLRVLFDEDYDPERDTFFATAQMRLVPLAGSDVDLDDVRLLGNCGLDFYLNETSTRKRDYPGQPVPSAGHPRSKLLTDEWQAFNWYSFPLDQPAQNGEERTWEELRDAILADPPPTIG